MGKKLAPQSGTATRIPEEQLDLPVTFDPSGKTLTLRQVMQLGHPSALLFASLSPEKRAELTAERIEAQPRYVLAILVGGIVDKARAVQEVRAQTEIGKVLIEIEQRVIQNLLERVGAA